MPSPMSWAPTPVKTDIAYVNTYAETINGADISELTPDNVTAMVAAYQEMAAGADMSLLHPDEITAYISKYLESNGVDTSGLTPADITAFVMAYEEVTGGALTTALTPDDITAMVARYAEAENIDLSLLTQPQIEAIVSSFAEATNCDKGTLLQNFTAYIAKYDDSNAVKPDLSMSVGIYGYDLMAYRQFVSEHPVEVQGIVRLGEVYSDPTKAVEDSQTKFYQNGVEIPVTAVPTSKLTSDQLAVVGEDDTLHVLIAPEITGTEEAIGAIRPLIDEVERFNVASEMAGDSFDTETTMGRVKTAVEAVNSYSQSLDMNPWERFWSCISGGFTDQTSMNSFLTQTLGNGMVAELSAYVGEIVAAIQQGKQVSESDIQNLQDVLTLLQGLDTTGTGTHIKEGVAMGMTEAGWDSDAETVAANLEAALNNALGIHSPSERVKPVGENVAAGVGVGMAELKINSPSLVFRDEVGVMTMRGMGEGIVKETKAQAKVIRNAARYLTGEAKAGAITTANNDNRTTYNNNVNSTISWSGNVTKVEVQPNWRLL